MLPGTVQEVFVGVKDIIPEELVGVTVKCLGSRLQNRVDVTASIPALTGVIK